MKILFMNHLPGRVESEEVHDLLRSYASPNTQLDFAAPDDFPGAAIPRILGNQRLSNGLCHAMVTPTVVKKVVWAEKAGYDAVVMSNTFDPGVEIARLCVRIPVIGVFRAALHFAATLGRRIGVVVPLDGLVPHTERIIQSYEMSPFVTAVRSFGMYGTDAELRANRETLKSVAAECMRQVVEETGAEVVIPLGGVLIPYIVSTKELSEIVGVPVINTKASGIQFAELCHISGVSHSPATYPTSQLAVTDFEMTMAELQA